MLNKMMPQLTEYRQGDETKVSSDLKSLRGRKLIQNKDEAKQSELDII